VHSVESRSSWIVAIVGTLILSICFGAPWITIVGLKVIAAETGGLRSVPALATALAWLGYGIGGIAMGRIAEKVGLRWTVIFGAVSIAVGLALSSAGATWQLYVGHGVFVGFFGIGSINAPLYIYISRWFDRRRGSALALISSGNYVAGAGWPALFERAIDAVGWRQTMFYFGLLAGALIIPLAMFLRAPPELQLPTGIAQNAASARRVLDWPPNLAFSLLATAAVFCCMPMAMPQAHLPALCSDLGILASHGAAMVSVLLGTAFLSRQLWGWISDRIGGLNTVLVASAWQLLAMIAFAFTQDEVGLFTVAAAFGLGFSGIVPAYVLAIRELFPAAEAFWRIPVFLLCAAAGMGAGGWLAGMLYDHFGFYFIAFMAGVGANAVNLMLISVLVFRKERLAPALALVPQK
jgi:MFS family permease